MSLHDHRHLHACHHAPPHTTLLTCRMPKCVANSSPAQHSFLPIPLPSASCSTLCTYKPPPHLTPPHHTSPHPTFHSTLVTRPRHLPDLDGMKPSPVVCLCSSTSSHSRHTSVCYFNTTPYSGTYLYVTLTLYIGCEQSMHMWCAHHLQSLRPGVPACVST